MSRLDDYRMALLAAHPGVPESELAAALEARDLAFARFIIDHGLGPLWHERTQSDEFYESRMQAEALFALQQEALIEIDTLLANADIEYVAIKGAANRLLLYGNPAVRACFDLDLLVRPEDRVAAASAFIRAGFSATAEPVGISRVIVFSRGPVNIDLHWGLLREGRLRTDPTLEMLHRKRRVGDIWMPGSGDTLFVLLVHPAFAKHLAGWGMGLHRVADLLAWIGTQDFDWAEVRQMLQSKGVCTAAWATLRWTQLLSGSRAPSELQDMLDDLRPGRLRTAWIDSWLRNDLPSRTSGARWARLLGFSLFLHDTPMDAMRAASGRRRAQRRSDADLAEFRDLNL